MSNKTITKEAALDYHREMWMWIASQYGQGSTKWVDDLISTFAEQHGTDILNACCYYNVNEITDNKMTCPPCHRCPVVWGTESYCGAYFCEYDDDNEMYNPNSGLILQIHEAIEMGRYKLAIRLAIKIANLSENMKDNYQNENAEENRKDLRW